MRKKRLRFAKKGINYEVVGIVDRGGTQKAIGIEEVIQDAIDNGVNTICAITNGNYGASLKDVVENHNWKVSSDEDLKLVSIVHPDTDQRILGGLKGINSVPFLCEAMKTTWLDPVDREKYVKERLEQSGLDPGVVKDYTDFIPNAYYENARGILEKDFDFIFIPVGTGKSFVALYRTLEELKKKGKEKKTKIIGVVPKGENPIYHTFVFERQEDVKVVKKIEGFNPSSIADKLVCPDTAYNEEIKRAKSEGHAVLEVDNKAFRKADRAALGYGHDLEYSGSASFVALDKKVKSALSEQGIGIGKGDNVGLFATGKGFYSTSEYELRKRRLERLKRGASKAVNIATITTLIAGLITLSYLRSEQPRIGSEYRRSVNKIVRIYENDPNGMGRVLGEAISGDNLPSFSVGGRLISRYKKGPLQKLNSDDLKKMIREYKEMKQK